MSYDFAPDPAPLQTDPDAQALADWAMEMFQRLEDNLINQRPGWQDLRVPLNDIKLGGINDPDFVKIQDDGAGSTGIYGYAFDKSREEEAFFVLQLPHGRVPHTDLRPHIHWSPTNSDTGVVVWGIEATEANPFSPFPRSTFITGEQAASGVFPYHSIVGLDSGQRWNGMVESAMILCRVFRDATNPSDTYNADAVLLEVDFHALLGQIGSDKEYPS